MILKQAGDGFTFLSPLPERSYGFRQIANLLDGNLTNQFFWSTPDSGDLKPLKSKHNKYFFQSKYRYFSHFEGTLTVRMTLSFLHNTYATQVTICRSAMKNGNTKRIYYSWCWAVRVISPWVLRAN